MIFCNFRKFFRALLIYLLIGHNALLPLAVASEKLTKTENKKKNKRSKYQDDILLGGEGVGGINMASSFKRGKNNDLQGEEVIDDHRLNALHDSADRLPALDGGNLLKIEVDNNNGFNIENAIAKHTVRLGEATTSNTVSSQEGGLANLDASQKEREDRARALHAAFADATFKQTDINSSRYSVKDEASYWEQQMFSHFESEANTKIEAWLGGLGTVRSSVSIGNDFTLGDINADLFIPLLDAEDRLLFTQFGLRMSDVDGQARNIFNIGIGQRNFSKLWMFGYNAFFDYDFSRTHSRAGVGGEAWHENMKISSNLYIPLSGWKASEYIHDHEERPATGIDVKAKAYIPSHPQMSADLTYEYYLGDKVDILGNQQVVHNPDAVTIGMEYTPVPLLGLRVSHTQASGGQNSTTVGINLEWKLGATLTQMLSPGNIGSSLQGRRHELVERNNNIVLEYREVQPLKVELAHETVGTELKPVKLTVDIGSKHGISHIEWQGDIFVAMGMSADQLNGRDKQTLILPHLPMYLSGETNRYPISVIVRDITGNEQRAHGFLLVQQDHSLQPVLTLQDDKVTLSAGESYKISMGLLEPRDTSGEHPQDQLGSLTYTGDPILLAMIDNDVIKVPDDWTQEATFTLEVTATLASGHQVSDRLEVSLKPTAEGMVSLMSQPGDNDGDGIPDDIDPDDDNDNVNDPDDLDPLIPNGALAETAVVTPNGALFSGKGGAANVSPHQTLYAAIRLAGEAKVIAGRGNEVIGDGKVVTYMWQRSDDGVHWEDIIGETGDSYTPTRFDQGYFIRVNITSK